MTLNEIWLELVARAVLSDALVVHPLETTPPRAGTWEAEVDFQLSAGFEPLATAIVDTLTTDLRGAQVTDVWITGLETTIGKFDQTWKLSFTVKGPS